jgi:hypothetical protein
MYSDVVIRKQLYITQEQDAELKRRSAELGMSEAEFVRRALEVAFHGPAGVSPRTEAAAALLTHAEQVRNRVGSRQPPWTREELYEQRLARAERSR